MLDQYDRRKTTIPKLKTLRSQEQENKEGDSESQVNDGSVSARSTKKRKSTNKKDPDFDYGSQPKGKLKENNTTIESKKKNLKLAMLKSIEISQVFFIPA